MVVAGARSNCGWGVGREFCGTYGHLARRPVFVKEGAVDSVVVLTACRLFVCCLPFSRGRDGPATAGETAALLLRSLQGCDFSALAEAVGFAAPVEVSAGVADEPSDETKKIPERIEPAERYCSRVASYRPTYDH